MNMDKSDVPDVSDVSRDDLDDALEPGIRFGLVVYGIVHLIVAWTALQLAFGSGQGKASSSGAMHQLADTPVGAGLLWAVAAGLAALVVWRVVEAAVGYTRYDGGKRLAKRAMAGLKALVYGSLAWSAVKVAVGSGSSSGTDSFTTKLMSAPLGQLLVGAVGLGILAYAGALAWKGWSEKFRKDLETEAQTGDLGTTYIWLGKIGHVAKGAALAVVGGLFCWAALTHDAKKSGGLDQALHEVLRQPFGSALLGVVGLGIACYGLYSFARARHLSR